MTCPVAGCCAIPKRGKLMCWRHWQMVPSNLQKSLWSAWRQHTTCNNDLSLKAYEGARQAAVDHVNAMEAPCN